ncbi:hypothetical protein C0J52_06333 [Blattella germanica]|nr:hypothetical protein C0J52_06333 [Blattella germanica]
MFGRHFDEKDFLVSKVSNFISFNPHIIKLINLSIEILIYYLCHALMLSFKGIDKKTLVSLKNINHISTLIKDKETDRDILKLSNIVSFTMSLTLFQTLHLK